METPEEANAENEAAARRAKAIRHTPFTDILKSAIFDPSDPLKSAKYLTSHQIRAARDIAVKELGCNTKQIENDTLLGIALILATNYQTTILKGGTKD